MSNKPFYWVVRCTVGLFGFEQKKRDGPRAIVFVVPWFPELDFTRTWILSVVVQDRLLGGSVGRERLAVASLAHPPNFDNFLPYRYVTQV